MNAENQRALQRGACPSLWTPMESGDGLLVRVRAGHGARGLRAAELRALVRLADAHGNGCIELTRRGRLQLRGVRAETLGALQAALVELGLAEHSAARERSAALITNPYAGLSHGCAELDALARELERALAEEPACERLSDKFGVVLDSGFALRDIAADIHVDVPVDAPGIASVHVASTDEWLSLAHCPLTHVVPVVMELCRALGSAGDKVRMRALVASRGLEQLRVGIEQALAAAFASSERITDQRAAAPAQAPNAEVRSEREPGIGAETQRAGALASALESCDSSDPSARTHADVGRRSAGHAHAGPATTVERGAPAFDDVARADRSSTIYQRVPTGTCVREDAEQLPAAMPGSELVWTGHRPQSLPSALGFHTGARSWLELGVAFGASTSHLWNAVADLAERFGDGEIRFTPARRVIVCGVAARDRDAALRIAADAGLITDAADPLLRTVACPGSPACSSAHGETRGLARELAPLLAAGESLHVSGCAKGCAHSGPSDVVLVRDPRGLALGLGQTAAEAADGPILSAARVRARFMQPRAAATTAREVLAADPEPDSGQGQGEGPHVFAARDDGTEATPSGLAQEPKTEQARHPATPA